MITDCRDVTREVYIVEYNEGKFTTQLEAACIMANPPQEANENYYRMLANNQITKDIMILNYDGNKEVTAINFDMLYRSETFFKFEDFPLRVIGYTFFQRQIQSNYVFPPKGARSAEEYWHTCHEIIFKHSVPNQALSLAAAPTEYPKTVLHGEYESKFRGDIWSRKPIAEQVQERRDDKNIDFTLPWMDAYWGLHASPAEILGVTDHLITMEDAFKGERIMTIQADDTENNSFKALFSQLSGMLQAGRILALTNSPANLLEPWNDTEAVFWRIKQQGSGCPIPTPNAGCSYPVAGPEPNHIFQVRIIRSKNMDKDYQRYPQEPCTNVYKALQHEPRCFQNYGESVSTRPSALANLAMTCPVKRPDLHILEEFVAETFLFRDQDVTNTLDKKWHDYTVRQVAITSEPATWEANRQRLVNKLNQYNPDERTKILEAQPYLNTFLHKYECSGIVPTSYHRKHPSAQAARSMTIKLWFRENRGQLTKTM